MFGSATKRILRESRSVVRARLADRTPSPVGAELWTYVPPALAPRARRLLTALGASLQLDVDRLRPTERLVDVLTVTPNELRTVTKAEFRRTGLTSFVQSFPYDIMYVLEKSADRQLWREARRTLPRPPKNEEQWIDTFMGMTVVDFLSFFASAMRQDQR
jgi:hypothetical protein